MPSPAHALWNHRLGRWKRSGGGAAMTRLWDAVVSASLRGRGVPANVVREAIGRQRGRGPWTQDGSPTMVLVVTHGDAQWTVAAHDFLGIVRDVATVTSGDGVFGLVDGRVVAYEVPPGRTSAAVRVRRGHGEVLLPASALDLGRPEP